MTTFSNEVRALLAKWKGDKSQIVRILFEGAIGSETTSFAARFEMEGRVTGFNEKSLAVSFEGTNKTSLRLDLLECRDELGESLRILFPKGEICVVAPVAETVPIR